MTKKILFFAVSFVAVVAMLMVPYNLKNNIQQTNIVSLKAREVRDSLSYKAFIEPEQSNSVILEVPVIVDKVYVQKGQSVEAGDLLFSIKTYGEMMNMPNVSTDNINIENIIGYFMGTAPSVEEIKMKYDNLEKFYYANESSVIKEINIKENKVTKPMSMLITTTSLNELKLYIDIPPSDISKIKQGMDIMFNLPSNPDKEYVGTVLEIPRSVNNKLDGMNMKQYITIEANIKNKDENLIEGLSIYANIYVGDNYKINVLPYTTIEQDEKGEFVYILNKDKPKKTYIKTGKEIGNLTEVKAGITNKDMVIDNIKSIKINSVIKVAK